MDSLGRPLQAEVKARKSAIGWTVVKGWLADNDMLLLVEDRHTPLVVLPWSTFAALVSAAEGGQNEDT